MTCEHVLDDGAYVLGALSPAERADFERHLATCASCREAVASLAVLPGLLGRLDLASAVALAEGSRMPQPAPTTILPRVLAAADQQRRYGRRRTRRRRAVFGAAFALAALMLVVGVGMVVHMRDIQPTPVVAMAAMRPAQDVWIPISADVGVEPTTGGSMLHVDCWYSDSSNTEGQYVMRLVVYSTVTHQPETIGTWSADPGEKLTVTGRTHLTPAQIDRVELQRADDNSTLLWWTPS
jgi:hypothetical protein